jgi:hypothetical protein
MLQNRSSELMRMADHLEEMGKYFNSNWAAFESDFFSVLLQSNYRPGIVTLTGKKTHYFAIDYQNRKLIERDRPNVLLDISTLDMFGKLIADEMEVTEEINTLSEKGDTDESGHTANYAVE